MGKALAELNEKRPKCPKTRPHAPCPHLDEMKRRTAEKDCWWSNPCAGTCCIDCWNIDDCKDLCDHAKPEKDRRKQDRKEAAAQRKREEAEREAPLVNFNRILWARFAEARKKAGKSVEDCFAAMGRSYSGVDSDKAVAGYETGDKEAPAFGETPYGVSISPGDVRRLCRTADLFGVSLDYLLGRTDKPEVNR